MALRVLPHPRKLVLCDLYAQRETLSRLQRHVERDLGFAGPVSVVTGDDGLPPAVLETSLIVSAVDRTGLVDPTRLRPGTILLDDSYPPTFTPDAAWRRMDKEQDVIVALGGFASLPGPVLETFYVPDSAQAFLEAYGRDAFLSRVQRHPSEYTACVFAGPLALADPLLPALPGIPTADALQGFHAALSRHGIAAAWPRCGDRSIPETLFARLQPAAS